MSVPPARASDDEGDARPLDEAALGRAVAAYARALRLSCHAARAPTRAALANEAVTAHLAARTCAEEVVRRAAGRPAETA